MREGGIYFSVGDEKKELDDLWWRQRSDPGGMRPELWPPQIKAEQSSEELVDNAVAIKLCCANLKLENQQDVDEQRKLQQDRSILMAKLSTVEWGEVERRVKRRT